MNMDWRWAALPAAVAFILSLLTGIVAGIDFLTLLLRALLGSALFAALGTGASALVERQLPELLESPGSGSRSPQNSRPRVDITVGDDEDTAPPARDGAEDEVPDDEDDTASPDGVGLMADDGDIQSLETEDIEEVTPTEATASRRSAPQREEQDITESLVEEVEESALPDEELTRASQFEEEETSSEELESVDELPDIGGFEGAFEGGGPASGESDGEGLSDYTSSSSSRSSRSLPEGLDAGNDPAQIAKAMQTMLKRDS